VAGEGKIYADAEDVSIAYDAGAIDVHAMVKVKLDGNFVETTVGRMLFSEILPRMFPLQ